MAVAALSALNAGVTALTGKETEAGCEVVVSSRYSSGRTRYSRRIDYSFSVEAKIYTGTEGLIFNANGSLCREGRMMVVYSPLLPYFSYPKGTELSAWMPAVALAMLAAVFSTLG